MVPAIQARWTNLVARAAANGRFTLHGKVEDWLAGNLSSEPAGARAQYEADGALRAEAAAVLAEGPPVPGGLGSWLSAGRGAAPSPFLRCENLLGVKGVEELFLQEAAFAADPGPALASLDRLHAAFARPGTLIDGMIGLTVAEARDEIYARLAYAGRLPREAGDRWLAEEPVEPLRVVESLRGERLLFLGSILNGLETGRLSSSSLRTWGGSPGSSPLRWLEDLGGAQGWWMHGFEAGARTLDYEALSEKALREGRAMPSAPAEDDAAGRLAGIMIPNMDAAAASALIGRQRHRRARLFVRLVRMAGEPGGLPADGSALKQRLGRGASLLDAGPLDFRVLYARPAPGRVRIGEDFAGPIPPGLATFLPPTPRAPGGSQPGFVWQYGWIDARLPR